MGRTTAPTVALQQPCHSMRRRKELQWPKWPLPQFKPGAAQQELTAGAAGAQGGLRAILTCWIISGCCCMMCRKRSLSWLRGVVLFLVLRDSCLKR